MANKIYDKGRQKFLEGSIAWLTNDIKCVLIDVNYYTVNINTDEWLSNIPSQARVAISGNLFTKTSTNGVASAAYITVPSVSGDSIAAIVIFKDTGVEGTSPLIAYIDTGSGLPIVPNDSDIILRWDASGIFKL